MCLRKNCSPVQVECRHCKAMFCAKHVQCEIHQCSANLKEPVIVLGIQPPLKVVKI